MKIIFSGQRSKQHHLIFLLVSSLGLLIACDSDPAADPAAFEKPYVFGILSPAAKQHEIFLAVAQFQGNPKPIDDARVRLSGPTGEVTLASVGKGRYRNNAATFQVMPGQNYFLHLTLRDGHEITGAVTIPTAFRILRPAPNDTFKIENVSSITKLIRIPTNWTKATGSWLMQTEAYLGDTNDRRIFGFQRLTTNTAEIMTIGIPSSSSSTFNSGILKITQFDSAYSIYYLTKNFYCYDGPYGNPLLQFTCDEIKRLQAAYQNRGLNVTGAYGMFGAVVSDSLRFFIKPQPGQACPANALSRPGPEPKRINRSRNWNGSRK